MSSRDLFYLAIICLAWAGSFLASAYGLQQIPPMMFAALRLGLLALVLAPFVKRPPAGQWSQAHPPRPVPSAGGASRP